MTHADPRYLEAKRTIDDRALSIRVLDRLLEELPPEPAILEAGCGTGTMVPRLVDWGVPGRYRGVDRDERVIAFARSVRPAAFRYAGQPVTETETGFEVGDLSVSFETGDALHAFGDESDGALDAFRDESGDALDAFRNESGADLFVASGFVDLVPIPDLLSVVESSLRPGGLAYLPITFDGGTIFQPDHPSDENVEEAYHKGIADRPGRNPRAGRHLADELRARPGTLVAMAPSDWIVRPVSGMYPDDEAFFLGRILDFVASTIQESSARVPDLADWLSTRRAQLSAGTLTYVAHQYDFLYKTPE